MSVSGLHASRVSHSPRSRQDGSALVEYTIVVLFLVVVLLAADQEHTIRYLALKLQEAYSSFVYALSISWN